MEPCRFNGYQALTSNVCGDEKYFQLQALVGVPHALLGGVLVWVWTPKSNRGGYWAVGLFVYLCLFYFVFVR